MSGLLNEDLQNLSRWHGSRPHHEQKRFLRSVDSLYKAFQDADNGTWAKQVKQQQARQAQSEQQALAEAIKLNAVAAARASVEDPLNGPPRDTPRGLEPSASEPTLGTQAKPIDVFEQKKRQTFRRRADGDEDPNSLSLWLDGQSVSSQTTASSRNSRLSRFSDLTRTSDGGSSICSEPGTTNQLAYRVHKRALAANKRKFCSFDQHSAGALKDGIPNIGFPDSERHVTQQKEAYGDPQSEGANITKPMYQSVLRDNSHPFVQQFLDTATPGDKEGFAGMLRSLDYLRRANVSRNMSVQKQEMDLAENSRLWRPPRQRPMFDTSEINISKVPLGMLQQAKPGGQATIHEGEQLFHPPPAMQPPPSPSVSGLGSLPLSRLSTPAVL